MRVLTVLAVLALVASLVFAYVSSRRNDVPLADHTPTSSSIGSAQTIALAGPAPYEVYATSQLDDWRAYTTVNDSSLGRITTHVVTYVAAADADNVAVAFRGRINQTGEVRNDAQLDHFTRKGLTLDAFLAHADWTVFDISVRDEARTVDGHTFQCKKLEYNEGDPVFPRKRTHVEYWLSPEVPAGGLVEKREIQDLDSLHFDTHLVVIGFGTGSGVTWGTRPDGL